MSINPSDMMDALKQVEQNTPSTTNDSQMKLSESRLDNDSLIAQAKTGDSWHNAVLVLTGRLFKEGLSDDEIHAITDDLTTAEYTVEETRNEVQKMIDGARADKKTELAANKARVIRDLSQLSEIEYEGIRVEKAKELKMRTTQLDKFVEERRNVEIHEVEETSEVVEATKPAEFAVDAVDLANTLRNTTLRYAVLKHDEYATAIVLWSLTTWFTDAWRIMPHLYIRSMSKGSGKTTVLELVEAWCCRSFTCANISPAALFRVIEEHKPTLLLDEVDRYLGANEELNGIMNAGHTRRTANVVRLVENERKQYIPTKFNVFGGKCLAGLGVQQDTMMDRSIIVKMEKRLAQEPVEKKLMSFFDDEAACRSAIARFAEDNIAAAKMQSVDVPNLGNDRAQDNWQPLFIIAELIGGNWPQLCLEAYKTIETIASADAQAQDAVAVRIFRELAPKLERRMGENIRASELHEILTSDTDSEFNDWYNGKPLSTKRMKTFLTEAGVRWFRESAGSLYSLADIKAQISRYVR